jgi:membrane dipeptidase
MPIRRSSVSRREFLRRASSAAVAAPFVLRSRYRLFAESNEEYPERVVRLIREELVIDMLNQFLYRKDKESVLNDWLSQPGAFKRSDFELFTNSGVNAINFGLDASCVDDAEKLFTKWNSFLLDYPQWLARINSADDFQRMKSQGRYGIIFGLQSSAQFETVDAVNTCYGYGQRISQLSYNFRSLVADGAFEPHDGGVSEYGQKVIERMNQVGMAVDLGHASDRTKLDACEMSKAPVILSHGNCRALNPDSPRTSTDEAIRKLAKRGGVLGITCIAFMVKGTEPVTVEDVVNHFDHVRDLVGIEHVGIGSDAGSRAMIWELLRYSRRCWRRPTRATMFMERTRWWLASKDRNESMISPPLSSGGDTPMSTFAWFWARTGAECWEKSGMPDTACR